jgi:biopolymer transport protein ExbD
MAVKIPVPPRLSTGSVPFDEKSNQLDPFMCAMLSIMAFLLIAAPKTNGTLPVDLIR